jgi:hypothetical protein
MEGTLVLDPLWAKRCAARAHKLWPKGEILVRRDSPSGKNVFFSPGAKIGHFYPLWKGPALPPSGKFVLYRQKSPLWTLLTALPPLRGLLLGQAPGAKAAYFYRATETKQNKKSVKTIKPHCLLSDLGGNHRRVLR